MLLSAKAYSFNSNSVNRKRYKRVYNLYDWFHSLLIGVFSIFLVFTFIISSTTVIGSSMNPTFSNNDHLFIVSMPRKIVKGDIVVVAQDKTAEHGRDVLPLIKRVIATEGDVVDIDYARGVVFVNGNELDEPYINEKIDRFPHDPINLPLTVEKNCIFIMGDNRNNSRDSRNESVGQIDKRYVYGKVIAKYWPTEEFKTIENPYTSSNEEEE